MATIMFAANALYGSQVRIELVTPQQVAVHKEQLTSAKPKDTFSLPAIRISKPQKVTTSPQQRVVKLPLIGNGVLTTMAVIARKRRNSEAEEQKNEQQDEERFSDDSHHSSPRSEGVSFLANVVTLDDGATMENSEKETSKA